jgi:hypothetical protein
MSLDHDLFDIIVKVQMVYLTSFSRSKYDISRNRGVVCDIDVNIYIIYKRQVFEPFPRGVFICYFMFFDVMT